MKVVFFIQDFSRGHGSERVTALISSYLAEHGYEISIVSVCGENASFYKINNKIQLYTLINKPDVDNKKEFVRVIREYEKLLKKIRPQLVIDVFAAMSIYTNIVKKKLRIKNITWEHYNFYNNLGTYRFSRWMAIHKSDMIVTLTDTDKQVYKKYYPKLNIRYVYNPSPFEDVPLNLNVKKEIVVAVGRLTAIKGYAHLIDIWSMVESKAPLWTLKIVGEGEDRKLLEDKIQRLGLHHIELPGETKNIRKIYEEASILVSTSDMEGLPMNMIEAQSFGIPIVSYDFYTGPKDIITDGMDGYIVSEKKQYKKDLMMSKRLLALINNESKRNEMMKKARESSVRFSIKKIGEEWIEIIEELLK